MTMAGAGGPAARGRRWIWSGAFLAAGSFLLLAWHPFDVRQVLAQIRAAKGGWIAFALASNLAVPAILTLQWRWLTPAAIRPTPRRMAEVVSVTLAAMNTLPFPAGHSLGVALLAVRAGIGWESALSVMALDQLCEGLSKAALFLLAAMAAPLPGWLHGAALTIAAAVALLAAILVPLSLRAGRTPGPSAGPLLRWTRRLEVLRDPCAFAGAASMSLAAKGAQAVGILAVQRSLGVDLPVSELALVLATVSVATMVPVSPGSLSVYEAAAFFIYRHLEIAAAPALALALLQHACFLVPMIAPGLGVMAWCSLPGRGPGGKGPDGPGAPPPR